MNCFELNPPCSSIIFDYKRRLTANGANCGLEPSLLTPTEQQDIRNSFPGVDIYLKGDQSSDLECSKFYEIQAGISFSWSIPPTISDCPMLIMPAEENITLSITLQTFASFPCPDVNVPGDPPTISHSTTTCADYVITTYSIAPDYNVVCVKFDNGQTYYETHEIKSGVHPVVSLFGDLNSTTFEISTESRKATGGALPALPDIHAYDCDTWNPNNGSPDGLDVGTQAGAIVGGLLGLLLLGGLVFWAYWKYNGSKVKPGTKDDDKHL